MARANILVGLEIGTSKICAVVGEVKGNNAVRILGVGESVSRGVRKGEITDFEAAQNCIHDALVKAEDMSNVMIRSVFLNVTGRHIKGINNRGKILLPDGRKEINEQDLEEVKELARNIDISDENVFIHSIIQQYRIDAQEKIRNPVGLLGKKLEADYHIIYGIRNRVHNTIRCVREIPIEVEDVVFSPVAAAQIILNRQAKRDGALVIDFGGGTLDYVIYDQGAIMQSGCIPIGGDHITNDLSQVLRIKLNEAEKIKKTIGSAKLLDAKKEEIIILGEGHQVKRSLINQIIYYRIEELILLLEKNINSVDPTQLSRLRAGIHLCGGSSLLKGFPKMLSEKLKLSVHCTNPEEMKKNSKSYKNPQYATPIGLIRYGQIIDMKQANGSMIRRLTESIGDFFGSSS